MTPTEELLAEDGLDLTGYRLRLVQAEDVKVGDVTLLGGPRLVTGLEGISMGYHIFSVAAPEVVDNDTSWYAVGRHQYAPGSRLMILRPDAYSA